MTFEIQDVTHDEVIRSAFAIAVSDYGYAVDNLIPLIGRFEEQRKKQNAKFYARLRSDILKGCVMPPLTIAFVSKANTKLNDKNAVQEFVASNIRDGYILDGMQRLNTLQSAATDEAFDRGRKIYLNIIIAERHDLLLYRMITLNNGQKPMTPRHQIEILTEKLLDFENLQNIRIQTEKDTEEEVIRGAFKLGDIAAAYTAFLANNVNNENNKIIEEKMNEILVGRVMESDLASAEVEFAEVVEYIDGVCLNEQVKRWLKVQNNLIGFSVACKGNFGEIRSISADEFSDQALKFDTAFNVINPSKVNVGRFRRELSRSFFEDIENFKELTQDEVADRFVDLTTSD
jgi:hypothetical protein